MSIVKLVYLLMKTKYNKTIYSFLLPTSVENIRCD